jgi:hypothetical protein
MASGPPGTLWISRKTSAEMRRSSGAACRMRRARNREHGAFSISR